MVQNSFQRAEKQSQRVEAYSANILPRETFQNVTDQNNGFLRVGTKKKHHWLLNEVEESKC